MSKMENQLKIKSKIDYTHIIMWFVFLYSFVIVAVNSFTFAQYTTSENGIDGSTIAKFYVNSPNTDSVFVDFDGNIDDEKTITFQIVNFNESVSNEVLLDYAIRIETLYNNLPLVYKLSCTNIDQGNNVSFDNAFYNSGHQWTNGKLLASTHCTHTYTLTIKWQSGQYDADTYANEIDLIVITIDSEQID